MAGSKSDAFEIDVLKWATGQATTVMATTVQTAVWLALFTAAPTDSTGGTEVTGAGYARVDVKGKFAVPSAGSVSNNAVIEFPVATGNYPANVVGFALMTASTGGTITYWGDGLNKLIETGDTPRFPIGSLTLTEA